MRASESITVLTTPERSDLFRPAVGERADFCFDPERTAPLSDFLGNIALAGGSSVILDEAYFISVEKMADGVRAYLDASSSRSHALRLIAVCSERQAGDSLLDFLVAYCGLYDIVYDRRGADVTVELERLMENPNTRFDVVELLGTRHHRQAFRKSFSRTETPVSASAIFPGSRFESQGKGLKFKVEIQIEPID